jgi:glycosyltransferase involved in cell wall biosynthesis
MLATDFSAPGGITAVVRSYEAAGLFSRWPIRFLPTYRTNSPIDKIVTAATALVRFSGWLLTGRVAAVHAHSAARASFWRKSMFLLLGKAGGARTILHLHSGFFPQYYDENCGRVRKRLIRWILASMDRVVVLTPTWAIKIHEIEPRACIEVIANGVSAIAIPRRPHAGTILFLGRLREEKGILDLLRAIRMLIREFPQLRLVCAGDGDIPTLRALAANWGIGECVDFPGWVEDSTKEELLASAAIFTLPSYFEGLPVGVLEAMINGVPVVATRVGGIPDALGSDAGLLVRPGDPPAIAQALAALLRDEGLRVRMGNAGQRRATERFGSEMMIQEIGRLYDELGLRPRIN